MTHTNTALAQNTEYQLWNQNYLLTMLANFFTSLVHFSLLTLLPLYALKIGGNNTEAGLLTGLYSFAALLFRPVFGKMLDKSGRKPVIFIGLVLITLSAAIYIFSQSVFVLLVFRVLNGIGFSAGSTAIATVVADILPAHRLADGIGYFGLSSTFAQAVGPLVGFYIVDNLGYSALFITLVAMSVSSLLCALVLKYPERTELKVKEQGAIKGEQGVSGFLETSLIWPSLLLLLTVTSSGAVMTFVADYALGLGITDIGLFFTVVSIGTIISRLIFGKVSGHFNLGHILVLSIIVVIISQIILGIATELWIFLSAAFLFGFGLGLVVPIINIVVVLFASPERKGEALSVYYCAFDIGIGCSAIIWGVVSQRFGYPIIYFLAAVCCGIALIIYYFTLRKRMYGM